MEIDTRSDANPEYKDSNERCFLCVKCENEAKFRDGML